MEVIGRHNSCEVAPLPEPRLGFTLARLKRTVVACGGFHIYERQKEDQIKSKGLSRRF